MATASSQHEGFHRRTKQALDAEARSIVSRLCHINKALGTKTTRKGKALSAAAAENYFKEREEPLLKRLALRQERRDLEELRHLEIRADLTASHKQSAKQHNDIVRRGQQRHFQDVQALRRSQLTTRTASTRSANALTGSNGAWTSTISTRLAKVLLTVLVVVGQSVGTFSDVAPSKAKRAKGRSLARTTNARRTRRGSGNPPRRPCRTTTAACSQRRSSGSWTAARSWAAWRQTRSCTSSTAARSWTAWRQTRSWTGRLGARAGAVGERGPGPLLGVQQVRNVFFPRASSAEEEALRPEPHSARLLGLTTSRHTL